MYGYETILKIYLVLNPNNKIYGLVQSPWY